MTGRILLGLLILFGLGVRLREIDQPIVRFHPTRHYRSAVLARACYYDRARDIPAWAKRVADANRDMQQAGELPLMEWLACASYLALGREDVAIPRAYAVIIWVSGSIPLWLLEGRVASPTAAGVAAALYLFLPYGIVASRNFQPDQLMTVACLWALLALVRHHDRPDRRRFATAVALVAAAGLVKPMSVFVTIPVALVLTGGIRIALLALIAPVLYYGYSAVAGSLVQDQMRMRFEPHLILTSFFWGGLANMIATVQTLPLFIVALLAMFFARDRVSRRVLAALFAGYVAFAIVFTYHMPTHDYYHLPYLAVTALGVSILIARWHHRLVVTAVTSLTVTLGTIQAWPRLHVDDAANYQRVYEEIGELAQHDIKALFLDAEYGFAMMYHGQISGDSWPNQDDLLAEAIDGRAAVDAETRFVRDYEEWGPRYFIVTDLASFNASPDLQALLDRRAAPVRITDRYRIYRFTR
ncbi:MAG TPA: glycosyltransferase family 39 protein [Vicinamibacterales bacterium]|nr:glycosyltransferase family 39 protein [Vicinamibacterales bacterium]